MSNDNSKVFDLRSLSVGVGVGLLILYTVAGGQETARILELKDVQSFRLQQLPSSPVTIKLTGLAFHSALAVQEVTAVRDSQEIQVLIQLMPASGGRSGNFEYSLVIPDSVNKVTFGKLKAVVWDRASNPTRSK